MANLTYQTKLRLKKGFLIAAIVLGVLLLLAVSRFLYLGRFVVYDEDGVHLDFGTDLPVAVQPQDEDTAQSFPLISDAATSADISLPTGDKLPKLDGMCFSADALLSGKDISEVFEGNAVLLNVKTNNGKFLYNTTLPDTEQSSKAAELSPRIAALAKTTGVTAIARLSAFRDNAFALSHFSESLPITGGALWMDEEGSYWLDPASEEVRNYLIAEAEELARMGFEEILFEDFSFPLSGNIVYNGDGVTAVRETANAVKEALDAKNIPVSFLSRDEEIQKLSARLFLTVPEGQLVSEIARKNLELIGGGEERLVFLTDSHDTRFEAYSVMTPYVYD